VCDLVVPNAGLPAPQKKRRRRSRQTIERSKGGNYVRVNVWIPVDVRKQAENTARTREMNLTDAVIEGLRAFIGSPLVRT